MTANEKARLEFGARIFKALAHPTRLLFVQELAKRERCVCELTDMGSFHVSTVSKHLAVLKSAGIVAYEKRGNQIFYRLELPCVLNFLDCIESIIELTLKNQSALLK